MSSLHDGMNLVAKEFVAAREDEDGVLVLSALAGAAQELREALIINPYDIDDFADALTRALDMPVEERRARMRAMRRIVAGRNVFSWASDILEGLESLWTKPLQYAARAPKTRRCEAVVSSCLTGVLNRPSIGLAGGTSLMMKTFSPGLISPSSRRAISSMAAGSSRRRPLPRASGRFQPADGRPPRRRYHTRAAPASWPAARGRRPDRRSR